MNREPSTAARALRAVSIAITIVSLVTFTTMAYSAYADVSGVLSRIGAGGGSGQAARLLVSGNTATLDMNFTVQNTGFYPLLIQLSCQPGGSLPVTCAPLSVSIPAGATRVVTLALAVSDVSKLQSTITGGQPVHLNATAQVSLEPFASLSASFDLGSALSGAAS